jgi:tight adherence protein C
VILVATMSAVVAVAFTRRPLRSRRLTSQVLLTRDSARRRLVGRRTHGGASRRSTRVRDAQVGTALAELCDLLAAAVRAGLNLPLALETVCEFGPALFRPACEHVLDRVHHGERLVDALGVLPHWLGESVRPLTRLLRSSERDGLALAHLVDELARDARRERRRQTERDARRLPVLMLGPLVGCVLPAFMILTVVPVMIASVLSLGS